MKTKKPNIIFIMMDSLRTKNLSCYGYYRNTSPNIDNLAKNGVLFKNNFASHNTTAKSFLSILGGRHVSGQNLTLYQTKEDMKFFFNSGGVLLQEILKNEGYKTYCLKKLYGWQKIGFDYSLEQYAQKESKKWKLIELIKKNQFILKIAEYLFRHFSPKKVSNMLRAIPNGKITTDKAIEIIKEFNKKDNFFMWIDYEETHRTYHPGKFAGKFKAERKSKNFLNLLCKQKFNEKQLNSFRNQFDKNDTFEDVIARYDSAIFHDDYLIGKIINTLKEKEIFENTIIFFLSDHGESLTEHEIYITHEGVYDLSFHVPLIICGRSIPKNKKIDGFVQLEDITPTVLDLLKIDYNPFLFDGQSLLPMISGKKKEIRDFVFMEEYGNGLKRRAIRTKKYKYMESPEKEFRVCKHCQTTHGDIVALYDLEKDPDENLNIAKKNQKILVEMKLKLEKTMKDLKTINEKRKIKYMLSNI